MELAPSVPAACRVVVRVDDARALGNGEGSRPAPEGLYADMQSQCPPIRSVVRADSGGTLTCDVNDFDDRDGLTTRLLTLSFVFSRSAELRGGLLVHGALAEFNERAVIFAGSSGVGKTTASERLPKPWRSLSDDTCLIVRDDAQRYWAHPWPTWSRFFFGGGGGSWPVERGFPLSGIFFLSREPGSGAKRISSPEGVARLVDSAGQSSWLLFRDRAQHEVRTIRKQQFASACDISALTPCYSLPITRAGQFWRDVEDVLAV